MTKTKSPPTIVRTGSHYVTIDRPHGFKEEVFVYVRTDWRGTPALVTMHADRYEHSSGLSDWRVYAQEARELPPDEEDTYRGNHLTATAKTRLSTTCRPLVEDWLASEAYTVSESAAYAHAVERELTDDRARYADPPSRHGRRALVEYRAKLTPAAAARLVRIADALDAYGAAVRSAE